MINLKQNIIRQLNQIYGLSFKNKYKKELKERIIFFITNIYENKTLRELKLLKEEIEFNNLEIIKLKELFFNKYKEELLNNFNPLWYEKKEKIILTESEKRNAEAIILGELLKISNEDLIKLNEKYRNYIESTSYFFNRERILTNIYHKVVSKKINENKMFIKRKEDINVIRKMIEEDKTRTKEKLELIVGSSFRKNSMLEINEKEIEHIKELLNEKRDNLEEKTDKANAYLYEGNYTNILLNYEISLILLKKINEI